MKTKTIKTTLSLLSLAAASLVPLHAGDRFAEEKEKDGVEIEETDLVETGTYKGSAYRVDPTEKEIYVKLDNGKLIELYLKKDTEITKDGEAVEFEALKQDQKLEVKVEKKDDSLEPLAVKILE